MEKPPYVAYEINADIKDKGIAFAIKRAIGTFMINHGFEHRIDDFEANSNRFSAVLEIYDNGKYDFNINAFLEHIHHSGRLPTDSKLKPVIEIRPVPREEYFQPQQERDDIAWQKTVEGLQRKVDEEKSQRQDAINGLKKQLISSEESVRSLTKTLQTRQEVIDRQSKNIKDLERKVREGIPVKYSDPISAVVNCYLTNYQKEFFEAVSEWDFLKPADRGILVECQKRGLEKLNYIGYLNLRVGEIGGKKFADEEEFSRWFDSIGSAENVVQLQEYKKVSQDIERMEKDSRLVSSIEEQGASPELLESLKEVRRMHETRKSKSEKQLKVIVGEFESEKERYLKLKDSEERYSITEDFLNNANERRKREIRFPIVISVNPESSEIYLPSADGDSDFQKHLTERVLGFLGEEIRGELKQQKNSQFMVLKIDRKGEEIQEKLDKIKKGIPEDDVLKALGLKPVITVVSGN